MKLSIITINRNNADGLRKTLASVIEQTYRDIEYIVVDGASTDGSVDVIREMSASLNGGMSRNKSLNDGMLFTWISEPDSGLYNAMNKGIEIASGFRVVDALNRSKLIVDNVDKNKELPEYVLMLNSGDWLVDEHVIEKIMPELDGVDIIQGNIIENHGDKISRNRGYGKSEIDLFDILKGHFLHQASFCRRELFDKYGYFDESYRISADTKFFLYCLGRKDASFRYVDLDISNYDMTGISADQSGKWAIYREEELCRLREDLFSKRIFTFMLENDKKVRLYNDLRAHKWIWNLTMAVAHINKWFYKK